MYTILSSIQLTLFPEKHENDKPTWQESHWNENTWYLTTKIGYKSWDFKYHNKLTIAKLQKHVTPQTTQS